MAKISAADSLNKSHFPMTQSVEMTNGANLSDFTPLKEPIIEFTYLETAVNIERVQTNPLSVSRGHGNGMQDRVKKPERSGRQEGRAP